MTSAYQVHVTTLDRNVSVPHTDAGLRDLAVGDPLVYVGHQGDVWLRTVADVKRVWQAAGGQPGARSGECHSARWPGALMRGRHR